MRGGVSFESNPSLSLAEVHQLTSSTARYATTVDPESVLRKGLVEETDEFLAEAKKPKPSKPDMLSELGDVMWYVSEISRYKSISPEAIVGNRSLDEFQAAKTHITTPIFDQRKRRLSTATEPHTTLAIAALRVVDIMNPKNQGLWFGLDTSPELPVGLQDLTIAVGSIATQHELTLSAAIQHTMQKLRTRVRKPHVIQEAGTQSAIASDRSRLTIDPCVRMLVRQALGTHIMPA
jgi:NTP pyrophosphatase (non-canonical NTP hydrolase)